jgi:putative transposase
MPRGLVRYQNCGDFHFLTFSCCRRQPLLARAGAYAVFEKMLESVRGKYGFVVAGYVVMPEHVHLLVNEPQATSLSKAIQILKHRSAHALLAPGERRFWLPRYHDFNVWSDAKRIEKLRYLHRNPVRRGLVARPEDWPWSSFRHHATGEIGVVEIESQWTAARRQKLVIPPFSR